jgi:PAS domain-containing protein
MTHAAVVNRRGLQVEIEYTAVAMRDAHGRFAGAVIVSRARRQTAEIALQTTNESLLANAEALFEEKERAQVTLNSIGDAVISTNFSGQVRYLNVGCEEMRGWAQEDVSLSAAA